MEFQDTNNVRGYSVGRNTFAQLAGFVFDKMFFFILMLYFTRYIGARIYGEYLLVMSLILIFRMIVNFGLSKLFVRDLARDLSQVEEYLGNAIMLSIVLFALFYFCLLAIGEALGYSREIRFLIGIGGLSLLPFSIALLFEATLHAMQYISKSCVWGVLNGFLTALSSIIVLHLGFGLKGAFVAFFFVNLLYAGGLCWTLHKFNIHIKLKCRFRFIIYIMRNASPFAVFSIMRMVNYSIGIIILSKLWSSDAVGWFGAPFRFIETLTIIPNSVAVALFPVMSVYYTGSLNELHASYEKALRYLIIIGLPVCVIGAVLSKSIGLLIFGDGFSSSIPVLTILFISALIMFAKTPGTVVVLNSGLLRKFIAVYFVYLLGAIGINYFLISRYSYIGASVAMLVTEIIIFIIQAYFLKLIFSKVRHVVRLYVRPLLAISLVATGLIIFNYFPFMPLFILSFMIYFIILIISKEFSKEEVLRIRLMFLK